MKRIGQNEIVVYDQKEKIGQGMFGTVYAGLLNKTTKVAIKRLKYNLQQLKALCPNFEREVQCLTVLDHPHITKLYLVINDKKENAFYIISELCQPITLTDQIRNGISQEKAFKYGRQICDALQYMHFQRKIMHRDLKPDNILISSEWKIKIGDLGLAKAVVGDDLDKIQIHTPAGTPVYAAPNVVNQEKYSMKCDVWSAGLIFYEMLTGYHLFRNANSMYSLKSFQKQAKALLQENLKKQKINNFWAAILTRMIATDQPLRADFVEIKSIFEEQARRREEAEKIKNINNLENVHTFQEKQSPTITKKPIIVHKSKVPEQPQKNIGTVTALQKLHAEEIAEKQFSQAINLMNFLKERNQLNYEICNKFQDQTIIYPIHNSCKYIMSFFLLGWYYHQSLQFKAKFASKIVLSNGKVLNTENTILPKHNFFGFRENVYEKIDLQLSNTPKFMSAMKKKILQDYALRQQCKELFDRNSKIINIIKNFDKVNNMLDQKTFQEGFKEFFLLNGKPEPKAYKELKIVKQMGTMRLYAFLWLCHLKYKVFKGEKADRDERDHIVKWKEKINKGSLQDIDILIESLKSIK